jgi:hypothetical protein
MFQNIKNMSFNEPLSHYKLKIEYVEWKDEIYKFSLECESHILKF